MKNDGKMSSNIVKMITNPTNKSAAVKLMRRIVDRCRKNLRRQKITMLVALPKIMTSPNAKKKTVFVTFASSLSISFNKIRETLFVFCTEAGYRLQVKGQVRVPL